MIVVGWSWQWMGFDPESGNGGSSKVTPPPLATAFVHVQAQLFMSEQRLQSFLETLLPLAINNRAIIIINNDNCTISSACEYNLYCVLVFVE